MTCLVMEKSIVGCGQEPPNVGKTMRDASASGAMGFLRWRDLPFPPVKPETRDSILDDEDVAEGSQDADDGEQTQRRFLEGPGILWKLSPVQKCRPCSHGKGLLRR